MDKPENKIRKTRKPGGLAGKIQMTDDCFEPLGEAELALWYDSPIFPDDTGTSPNSGDTNEATEPKP